jgi:hypothetical protein
MKALEKWLLDFVTVETHPRTKQLLRIAVLTLILLDSLVLLQASGDIWTAESVYPRYFDQEHWWRILTRTEVAPYYQYFLFAHIAILVLGILGYRPRLMTWLAAFTTFNLHVSTQIMLDGGNALSELMLTYLLFIDSSGKAGSEPRTGALRCLLTGLSNGGFYAARLQLVTVYLTAGLCKMIGPIWQDGTALYLIFQHPRFGQPTMALWMLQHPMLTVIGTYFTIAFQLAFAMWIWKRSTRPFLFAAGAFLHCGIALLMGLLVFALFMMTIYVVFFAEAWSVWVVETAHRLARKVSLIRKSISHETFTRFDEDNDEFQA